MQQVNDSSSLIIVEPTNELKFNDSTQKSKRHQDLFDLSNDEVSLSFHIQEDNKISSSICDKTPISYQEQQKSGERQTKKKRKDIFQKYKKNTPIQTVAKAPQNDNKILKMFDQIFQIDREHSHMMTSNRRSQNQISNKRSRQNSSRKQRTPSIQRRQKLKIFGKKQKALLIDTKKIELDETEELLKELDSNTSEIKLTEQINKKNTSEFNLSCIEKKMSNAENLEASKDEYQLKNILEWQIFKEKQEIKLVDENKQQIKKQFSRPQSIEQISSSRSISVQIYENQLTAQHSMANLPSINPISDQSQIVSSQKFVHVNGLSEAESRYFQDEMPLQIYHVFNQQERFPIFLRPIRKVISTTPNLHSKSYQISPNKSQRQFDFLIQTFKKGVEFLSQMSQQILKSKSNYEIYMNQLSKTNSLEFFITSGWQKINNFEQLQKMRPIEPYSKRKWSYEKIRVALANYESILLFYGTYKVDVATDKGRKKYLQTLKKFWDIAYNFKFIGQDIFHEMEQCQFPPQYTTFLTYMKSPKTLSFKDHLKIKQLFYQWHHLKKQNDELMNSSIGNQILERLQQDLKFLHAY